jgi:predicted O-linked N-acetylglucosamine transferase (SPINDLY family)
MKQKPTHIDALHQLGLIAIAEGKFERTIELFKRIISIKPDYAEAYIDLAIALRRLRRPAEALASCEMAIAITPNYAMAYNNRANALIDLRRPAEALDSCDKALELAPNLALAHFNRGVALGHQNRFEEAIKCYERAIALKSDFAIALQNCGHMLNQLGRYGEAIDAYGKAFAIDPNLTGVEGDRLYTKIRICDWREYNSECEKLIMRIESGIAAASPFPVLAIASSSAQQLQCAKSWVKNNNTISEGLERQFRNLDHNRIRVGYFSADFHLHATAHLMAGIFENCDRSKFEIFGFSFGPDDGSAMRRRLENIFDRFIDVRDRSDRDVAALSRSMEIDIAVDLKGFTTDSRSGIFASRAAPIQVSYLGYPGTMGANYIDYLIADRTLIPNAEQQYFAEKIVYLPNSYQANDATRGISDRIFTRAETGLPESGFVFCCFNNNYKITPTVFDHWMHILRQVEGSVLWLYEDNASAATNLGKEAAVRGVNPERLVFAKRMPLAEHLARHRLADLFLDTLPYNAHTTASDALWAGLPVLTQIGKTVAGRVASSLLRAIGLTELITATPQAYQDLAIELARNPEKLAAVKAKLGNNRLTTPLFHTKRFASHLEAAYTAIYERYHNHLPPEHIYVPQKKGKANTAKARKTL